MTFAKYVTVPFYPGCQPPEMLQKMLAILALLIIMTVNGLSVKLSSKINIFFTVAKLLLVFLIVLAGIVQLCKGKVDNFKDSFEGTSTSASAWAIAIYSHG